MSNEKNIITTIPRSATERIEIAINEYNGKNYLDLRTFYTTDEGASWLPTKKGITVSPDNLELLKEAIEQAMGEFADE